MNKVVTSKEHILEAAKEIAYSQGLSEISIRGVAGVCGVSVGSIYNYFPTKADLVMEVVGDFWKSVFHKDLGENVRNESFVEFFGQIYGEFYEYLKEFQENFLQQIASFSAADKQKGRAIEAQYMRHIQKGMGKVLSADPNIDQKIWTREFSQENFIAFVFGNMMMMLRNNQRDCGFFQQVLAKLLYN